MEIGGFQKFSVNNFPGFIAAVVFTQGCNFHCHYCHNKELIPIIKGTIDEEEILDYLEENKNFLDGLVITGGEPCLQSDLIDFIRVIKKMDLMVKLDTNGSFDIVVKELIENNLIDYIAMDIKSPPDEYHLFSGSKKTWDYVKKTLYLLRNSEIDYELRTTSPEKPDWIKYILVPGEKWFWQKENEV